MLALDVLLDVVCCACGESMAVSVKCEGEGLTDGSGGKALANLSCLYCRKTNYVIFAPESGEVIDVLDCLRIVGQPEPSLN